MQHQVLQTSTEHKIMSVGPFGLTMRQGLILAFTVGLFYLFYEQLTRFVPLNAAQTAALFAPIGLAALAVAFVKIDGRHLDFYLVRWWFRILRPSASSE
jgi:uncharacterized membrane protein